MNFDDFENKLARRKIRPVPEEWRDDILGSVSRSTVPNARTKSHSQAWWRNLLWPAPSAWAGLACAWALILLLHLAATDEMKTANADHLRTSETSKDWSMVMEGQKLLEAELMGSSSQAKIEKKGNPEPRSDAGAPGFAA